MNDSLKSPKLKQDVDEDSIQISKESTNNTYKKKSFFSFNIDPDNIEMMDDEDESDSDEEDDNNKFEEVKPVNTEYNNDTQTELKTELNNNHRVFFQSNQEPQTEESEERKRFQIELEFVQSLANPNYLNFLAQRGYFKNQTFLNYLKYLMYWKEPEYCKYIVYPQCLSLLEMLQHEKFLKEIVNAQCAKYIDEQLLLLWLHYKKKHDWIRIDPCKIPNNIEKLFPPDHTESDSNNNNLRNDPFSANKFLENEKF